MAEFSAGQERMLKELISTFRCQVCRRVYDREQVRIAARHEQLWIVSVRCGRCRKQQVFCVGLKENGGETLLRDVSEAEEEQFRDMAPVSADEVLDMHEFLGNFDGNFKRLFESRSAG